MLDNDYSVERSTMQDLNRSLLCSSRNMRQTKIRNRMVFSTVRFAAPLISWVRADVTLRLERRWHRWILVHSRSCSRRCVQTITISTSDNESTHPSFRWIESSWLPVSLAPLLLPSRPLGSLLRP